MNKVNSLTQNLKEVFPWHQARIQLIAQFMLAMIQVRTTNLTELAWAFKSQARPESSYKRLRRFLRDFRMDDAICAKVIAQWFCPKESWLLSLDRTNWHFGKSKINFSRCDLSMHWCSRHYLQKCSSDDYKTSYAFCFVIKLKSIENL